METIKNNLTKTWKGPVKEDFMKGVLIYERQVQAVLYKYLIDWLPKSYEVWVEPVIYLEKYNLDKVKTDMVFCHGQKMIGVLELKFKPWEYIPFEGDLEKLSLFHTASQSEPSLALGYVPYSPIWENQLSNGKKLSYIIEKNLLKIMVTFGRPESGAFNLNNQKPPSNFFHLIGYFKSSDEFTFESKYYN